MSIPHQLFDNMFLRGHPLLFKDRTPTTIARVTVSNSEVIKIMVTTVTEMEIETTVITEITMTNVLLLTTTEGTAQLEAL